MEVCLLICMCVLYGSTFACMYVCALWMYVCFTFVCVRVCISGYLGLCMPVFMYDAFTNILLASDSVSLGWIIYVLQVGSKALDLTWYDKQTRFT